MKTAGPRRCAWVPLLLCAVSLMTAGVCAGCRDNTSADHPPTSMTPRSAASSTTSSATKKSANPVPGGSLVVSSMWIQREGKRSLDVVPSDYLRSTTDSETAARAWSDLVKLVPAADSPGMRDQFICHVQFAPNKKRWYLEPWRPPVGYNATVLAGCNPGNTSSHG